MWLICSRCSTETLSVAVPGCGLGKLGCFLCEETDELASKVLSDRPDEGEGAEIAESAAERGTVGAGVENESDGSEVSVSTLPKIVSKEGMGGDFAAAFSAFSADEVEVKERCRGDLALAEGDFFPTGWLSCCQKRPNQPSLLA